MQLIIQKSRMLPWILEAQNTCWLVYWLTCLQSNSKWNHYMLRFLPTVSKLCAKETTPALGTASYEGRNPKIPQYDAGTLTLPPVSVPVVERTFYFTLPTTNQNTSRIIQIGEFTQGEVYNFCTNRNSRPTWRSSGYTVGSTWIYRCAVMYIFSIYTGS